MPHGMPLAEPRNPDNWSPGAPDDALTVYAGRRASDWLRGWAKSAGIQETALFAVVGLAGAAGFLLFWHGRFGLGLIVAAAFIVVSLSVEPRRRVAAWTVAIVPLFWCWAWSHGLAASGHPLTPVYGLMVLWAAIGCGVADLALALIFRRSFDGLAIEHWQGFDTRFALVAAGPSTNLALLAVGYLVGRPEAGLVVVAWWSIATVIVHAVRFAQAGEQKTRGQVIQAWRRQ